MKDENENPATVWPAEKIEMWDVDDLEPYARNARTHPEEQIEQIMGSMKRFGFTIPMLVVEDGTIIAGHGRLEAAKRLGYSEVPVMVARGWTEEMARAYTIADNRLAETSEWDVETLRFELEDLGLDDTGLLFDMGFAGGDLNAILGAAVASFSGDEDAVPEVPADPVTVEGDVWLLGRHRLMCGDSTSIDAVDNLMDGRKANMLHTDPPYGVDYEGVPNDHLKDAQLEAFLHDALSCAFSALAPGSNIYVWHADITALEFISAFRSAGFKQARNQSSPDDEARRVMPAGN